MGSVTSSGTDTRDPLCGILPLAQTPGYTSTPCVGSVTSSGIDTRLHVYPLCGICYFLWHTHQATRLPPVWDMLLPLAQTPGYTSTPCVGSVTSSGIDTRLHVYPLCGICYFLWHRHQATRLPPVWDLLLPLAQTPGYTSTPCVGYVTSSGTDTRLHVYPLCGICYVLWHRHQATRLPPVWDLLLPLA